MKTAPAEQPVASRAALYMRVSTGRQAESDLSIPDQRRQATAFCKARGWEVVNEFVDAGLSGTTDNRPELQRLLDLATNGAPPFDVVVVHSLSRFMRDAFLQEMHVRRLAKAGVRLVSMTQDVGDDPVGVMVRQVFALFDEYQSNEIRKHVSRSMNENARQGFWNGAAPPFGYTTVVVGQRGARFKKKLAIDPVEAETVRLMFRLLTEGDGTTGPMGVKAAVCWLNERGYRTRGGARWGIGPLYNLISNTVYKGEAVFNRMDSKTRKPKPVSEHIIVPVDPIIDPAVFDALQAQMRERNPKVLPPRVVTGPILLTGIATCASCGGGMTIRTGKSGRYRYYVCAAAAQKGKTACAGRSVPMDRLDNAVMDRVSDELLMPDRVADMLRGLMDRQTKRDEDYGNRLTALRGKLSEAEGRLTRLYQAIENGIADPNDPTLKDRIAAVKTERDIAQAAFDRAVAEMRPEARITEEKIASFVGTMRDNVLSGDTPFRRAWLRAVIDGVEVDDREIRIHGRRTVLERLVMGGGATPAGVPSFVRKWRTRRDSNS
ncbi:recombinase family protein [Shinella pollutisoli]|uniref:Recombinase family protein n=1 Tax=Shinella pollutisoli TaxID=2250594 RepID=A0ABV7DBE2_9HYPH|nr:recombinase family protein [Shinella pollutisoli]